MTRAFTTNGNDQLLVVYLSALVRAVIALEKLVDNKATNGMAELEEGGVSGEGTKKKKASDKEKGAKEGTKEGEAEKKPAEK